MKYILFVLAFAINPAARASAPSEFLVKCGENLIESPVGGYPAHHGLPVPSPKPIVEAEGRFVQMSPNDVNGYWTGGTGYRVQLDFLEPVLFGDEETHSLQMNCYWKAGLEKLSCMDASPSAPNPFPAVESFNSLNAAMPLVDRLYGRKGTGLAEFSVRTMPSINGTRKFYRRVREIMCMYLPVQFDAN